MLPRASKPSPFTLQVIHVDTRPPLPIKPCLPTTLAQIVAVEDPVESTHWRAIPTTTTSTITVLVTLRIITLALPNRLETAVRVGDAKEATLGVGTQRRQRTAVLVWMPAQCECKVRTLHFGAARARQEAKESVERLDTQLILFPRRLRRRW